jgi:hypothetical protein
MKYLIALLLIAALSSCSSKNTEDKWIWQVMEVACAHHNGADSSSSGDGSIEIHCGDTTTVEMRYHSPDGPRIESKIDLSVDGANSYIKHRYSIEVDCEIVACGLKFDSFEECEHVRRQIRWSLGMKAWCSDLNSVIKPLNSDLGTSPLPWGEKL